MINHPNRKKRAYELAFAGSALVADFPRYTRWHDTLEEAEAAAHRVMARLDQDGLRAAHPAIVYGPGLGVDGRTVGGKS